MIGPKGVIGMTGLTLMNTGFHLTNCNIFPKNVSNKHKHGWRRERLGRVSTNNFSHFCRSQAYSTVQNLSSIFQTIKKHIIMHMHGWILHFFPTVHDSYKEHKQSQVTHCTCVECHKNTCSQCCSWLKANVLMGFSFFSNRLLIVCVLEKLIHRHS